VPIVGTAKAPYIHGKYNSPEFNIDMQLPWIGDSCTVECAGVARIPMECFEKALVAFAEEYGI
jgi:hypothetical protein